MEDDIFDISFVTGDKKYTGWVNPSEKLDSAGKPVSFHVVLNDTSFAYLSYYDCRWIANEEKSEELVSKAGEEIEKHYSSLNDLTMDDKKTKDNDQHGGVTDKHDMNAGSGAFNQGSQQDEHLNEGVADGIAHPDKVSKEKENPKSGKQG
ncbi:MAG TPA: hypothetical protein VMZ03_06065 [Chitinophagaceae bacterium]|nr:hypothetical protein [Chitinophagaceae bacterium]